MVFNFTNFLSNFDNDKDSKHFLSVITYLITLLILPFISLLIFPCYFYVNRVNRFRDEKANCFVHGLFFICVVVSVIEYFFEWVMVELRSVFESVTPDDFLPVFLLSLLWIVLILFQFVSSTCLNFLNASLAFYRFLCVFFPKFGEKITVSKKNFNKIISVLYVITAVLVIGVIGKMTRDFNNQESSNTMTLIVISIDGLVVSSIFPYLLILRNTKKFLHLPSSIASRPETYIKYQILIVFTAKLLAILPVAFSYLAYSESYLITNVILISEATVTPVGVQMAYLLSNKSNVDALFDVSWRSVRAIFGLKNSVRPESVQYFLESTHLGN